MTDYRCKKCDTIVPRGHRMQYCQCGKIWADWGADGKGSTVRVGWPDGDPQDWIEVIGAEASEKPVGPPLHDEA
jgi:hypothetical protein